jgi:hypothetical protein
MTAVDFLIQEIEYFGIDTKFLTNTIEQANEMFEQQIIKANRDGVDMVVDKKTFIMGVEYYNETYGSKGSETQGYICPKTKKQCRDECCVSAEDCHILAGIGVIFDCEQEPTSSQTNSMNTFFILPLLTFCKFEDGKQINIGWLKKAWTINIEFKQPKKD